jgi:hypothetical protein
MTMRTKKIRKIFALALASVMTVGMMSTVAFASGSTSSSSGTTEITEIPITKVVSVETKNVTLPEETFYFSMTPADDLNKDSKDSNGNVVEKGPELTTSQVSIAFGANSNTTTGEATDSTTFDLDFVDDFDHTGIYRYYIKEDGSKDITGKMTNVSNGYITYDDTKYIVDLYVTQDSDSKFIVSNVITTVSNSGTTTKPNSIKFTNSIDCASLKIYKKVEGTEYTKGELYEFRILIPVGGTTITLTDGQKIKARICDANGVVVDTENNRTDANGNVYLEVGGDSINADMSEGSTFYLKDGEYLEIPGAPVSMIYKVEEVTDKIADEGYTVTYDYKETGSFSAKEGETSTFTNDTNMSGNIVQGTVNTDTNEVTFINTRNMEVPNSGIRMDVLPYVMILLIAICGGVIYFVRKRKAAR